MLVVAVALGCEPRTPPLVALFPREVTVYVAVSDEVARSEDPGVAAMVDAIEADLLDEGRSATIVPARFGEQPPLPRVELQVVSSRSADKQLQGAGKLGALLTPASLPLGVVATGLSATNIARMVVEVYVVGGDGSHPHRVGRFEGSSLGSLSEDDNAAGEEVGHDVVESLFR